MKIITEYGLFSAPTEPYLGTTGTGSEATTGTAYIHIHTDAFIQTHI
jgi:hypothetical protein